MSKLYPKIPILLLVLFILLSAALFPSYAVTGYDFTDSFDDSGPNEAYWGFSYIDYAAKVGIIQGYLQSDGSRIFLPRNEVTKTEAITMVVNTMTESGIGYTAKDYSSKWKDSLSEANLPEWVWEKAAFALEKGFLSEEELSSFMTLSQDGITYSALPASREEVITWVGRALWSAYKTTEDTVYTLTYTDAEEVSETARPYLSLLTRIGVIRGYEAADGTYSFSPKKTLTRVEFAVICNSVFELPNQEQSEMPFVSYSGPVGNLNVKEDGSGEFTIGLIHFYIPASCTVYYNGSPGSVGLSGLNADDTVVVSWGKDGVLHIDTHMVSLSGTVTAIGQADESGFKQITVLLSGKQSCQFYCNPSEALITGTLAKNKKVAFLLDGVNIIELTVK